MENSNYWNGFTAEERAAIEAKVDQRVRDKYWGPDTSVDNRDIYLREAAGSYMRDKQHKANLAAFEVNKRHHSVSNEQIWDFAAGVIADYWVGYLAKTAPVFLTSISDYVLSVDSQAMWQAAGAKNLTANSIAPITDEQEDVFRTLFRLYSEGKIPSQYVRPTRLVNKDELAIRSSSNYGATGYVHEALLDAGVDVETSRWLFPMKAYAGLSIYDGLKLTPHGMGELYIPLADLPKTVHDLRHVGRPKRPAAGIAEPPSPEM